MNVLPGAELKQSNPPQRSMFQRFVRSTREFDCGHDCSDENYTFYNDNYNDLILIYFVFQPIGELCSWPDSQYDSPDVASPAVRWECRIDRIQDQL